MPIRSYKLKLTVPRQADALRTREALWDTHQLLNRAIADFEDLLLLLRGRGYERNTGEGSRYIEAATVQRELLALLRDSQRANLPQGVALPGSDEELLEAVGALHTYMTENNKNTASNFLSVLYDPASTTGETALNFTADPEWLAPVREAETAHLTDEPTAPVGRRHAKKAAKKAAGGSAKKAARAAATTKAARQTKQQREQARQAAMSQAAQAVLADGVAWVQANPQATQTGGNKAFWFRLYRANAQDVAWIVAYADYITANRQKATDGWIAAVRRLKHELRALPLHRQPPIASRLVKRQGFLSGWDRMAFGKAVEHMLAWDSIDHNTEVDYTALRQRTENYYTRHLAPHPAIVEGLQAYERARHSELLLHGLALEDRPFRLNRRMIRKWHDLQQAWMEIVKAANGQPVTVEQLWGEAAAIQTDDLRKYGDPHLYRWLAEPANHYLWMGNTARFAVLHFATWRDLQTRLARKKQRALYTPPDACQHPRWTSYAPPGKGSPAYGFTMEGGRVRMKLPLLVIQPDTRLDVRNFTFAVAPSRQIRWLDVVAYAGTTDRLPSRVRFDGKMRMADAAGRVSNERFVGTLKELELRFERRFLENSKPARLAHGEVGSVLVSVPIDVDHQLTEATQEWVDAQGRLNSDPAEFHFSSGRLTESGKKEAVQAGFRAMAVDLRMRRLAACSVFELKAEPPARGLSFATDTPFTAKHEGSFLLEMDGDSPSDEERRARTAALKDLRTIRQCKKGLLRLRRVVADSNADSRIATIASLIESWRLERPTPLQQATAPPESIVRLLDVVVRPAGWQHDVQACAREWEQQLCAAVGDWRSNDRPRQYRDYQGGTSLWHIEYLMNVRKAMMGWSLRSRQSDTVRRHRLASGSFSAALLQHIDKLKDFHIKSGADLIVNRARGLVRRADGAWVATHPPCRLIVFEDLARYRMASDRPKYENRNLMTWAHRELVRVVTIQAELYGIRVATVGAGFSSRMHGATGAPGILCRRLSPADLQQDWVQHRLERLGIEDAQPGDLLPDDGGDLFVTLDAYGRPVEVEYNVNAALQLARRFWTRHVDAYRVVVQPVDGGWVPMPAQGTRVLGALVATYGTHALRFDEADEGFLAVVDTARRVVPRNEEILGSDDDLAEAAIAEEEAEESTGKRRSLYRDVTGHVVRRDRWFPYRDFWRMVERRVLEAAGARFATAPR